MLVISCFMLVGICLQSLTSTLLVSPVSSYASVSNSLIALSCINNSLFPSVLACVFLPPVRNSSVVMGYFFPFGLCALRCTFAIHVVLYGLLQQPINSLSFVKSCPPPLSAFRVLSFYPPCSLLHL